MGAKHDVVRPRDEVLHLPIASAVDVVTCIVGCYLFAVVVRMHRSGNAASSSGSGLEVMLRLESSLLASLSHPNIVQYFGLHYSKRRGEYHMLIEYVDGGSLADMLKVYPKGLPHVSGRV